MSALITPQELQSQLPLTKNSRQLITSTREQIIRILNKQDDRLLVVVGPCSIHHPESALTYAKKLREQIQKHEKTLCIVMRAYTEKARTSTGWKGLINDPHLNNTFEIDEGLRVARALLLSINECGVPIGAEILNPLLAPYFSDLMSWSVIGARTTESQIHRELASSLSLPVGFKNNTNGDIQVAIDAVQTAAQPHHFLGLDLQGKITILKSRGNANCHVVLRGSLNQTNYDINTLHQTAQSLARQDLIDHVLIDCSHGNSRKDHQQQMSVANALCDRLQNGDRHFFGVMLESYLKEGKQSWLPNQPVDHEQSITDACIGWEDTKCALKQLSKSVLMRRGI